MIEVSSVGRRSLARFFVIKSIFVCTGSRANIERFIRFAYGKDKFIAIGRERRSALLRMDVGILLRVWGEVSVVQELTRIYMDPGLNILINQFESATGNFTKSLCAVNVYGLIWHPRLRSLTEAF